MANLAAGGALAASQQFGANQTDVFTIDKNGQLNVFWVQAGGAWQGPIQVGPMGLANPGSPIAASRQFGADQTDVFVIDKNGQLNVFWAIGEGQWNGPQKIGPAGNAFPDSFLTASQQFGANQTDVFLVDRNGQLNVFWAIGEGPWNGPQKISPAGFFANGCILSASQQFGANQTDVFLVNGNGQLDVLWAMGEGPWNGPQQIGPGGLASGTPVVASNQFGANQTDIFLVDGNGQLNVFWVIGEGAWNGPVKIGPSGNAFSFSYLTASQQLGANQTDVFLVDNNGQLNVFWVVGEGAWQGPAKISPPGSLSNLIAASPQFGTNQTDVFAIDNNGQLNVFSSVPGGSWSRLVVPS